ncbi:hypothetical protein ASPFODRAFT_381080 [Aspergillus luchuensis CBS 106.47]|uniref:Uncharacterized protein n=1 Tax=Aspergillus luchuensis (strain CBS 106.47) TaxID=1137211 RepID=A0A1M3T2Y6_ASPLC|nr:hypothetical protein ASPFODRAFT_381080 [Aspergillus luchuensis CBS 106.47]
MRKEVGGLGSDSLHCFKGSLLSYFMVSIGIASMDEVTRLPTIRQLESGIKPQLFWLADRQNSATKHSLASPWSAIVKCPKGSRSYTRPLVCPCLESWPQCYLQLRLALGGPFRAGLARGVILLRTNETASLYELPLLLSSPLPSDNNEDSPATT